MKTQPFHIGGVSPLMMNNPRGANPLDPLVKERKRLTDKRKKSDDDHEKILRMDFNIALYANESGPFISSNMIEATLREAAKAARRGKVIQAAALVVENEVPLIYDGPKTPDGLWEAGFTDVRYVVVSGRKTMRCRPIFDSWELKFHISWDDTLINDGEIQELLAYAGQMKCIGDYRPRYGRFEVIS